MSHYFMTEACLWVKWWTHFLFIFLFVFEAESFITQSPAFPCFFSFFQFQSVMHSHHFLFSSQPLAHFHSFPKSILIWSIQEVDWSFPAKVSGNSQTQFYFLMLHIRTQRKKGIQEEEEEEGRWERSMRRSVVRNS